MLKPPILPPRVMQPVRQPQKAKTFNIKPWTDEGQGTKILIYSESGMGKTTLASMAPGAVFIGADDGGRMIINPVTHKPIQAIGGVQTFQDVRDALRQWELFKPNDTLVVDTITFVEKWAEAYIFEHVKTDQGQTASNIEDYGYGKGYKHLLDAMRLLISDMEPLVRQGTNILLLAQQSQTTVANLEGTDYLQDGPKLAAGKSYSVRTEFIEWVDHVFRIGHPPVSVAKTNKKAARGKVSGSTERMIYTEKELYYVAKNRMQGKLPPVVTFAEPADDSIWQFVFGKKEQI